MGGRRVRGLSLSNGRPVQSQWSSGLYNIVCSLTTALFEVTSLSQQRSSSFVDNSMLADTGPFRSNTILRWVENFRKTGNIMNKKPPGPTSTARTPENTVRASEPLIRSPRRSARRHATESVRSILQTNLRFHPYKMQDVQQVNVRDYAQRVDFGVRMQVILEENENAIIMSDEVYFHLNGTVNKQNLRYWAPEIHITFTNDLSMLHVTAWCAVAPFGVIGLYFFE